MNNIWKFSRKTPIYLIIVLLLSSTWLQNPNTVAACIIEMEIELHQNHWYVDSYDVATDALPDELFVEPISRNTHAKQAIRMVNTGANDWYYFHSGLSGLRRKAAIEAIEGQAGTVDERVRHLLPVPQADKGDATEHLFELIELDRSVRTLNEKTRDEQLSPLPLLPNATASILLTDGNALFEVPVSIRFGKNDQFDPSEFDVIRPPGPEFISSVDELVENYEFVVLATPLKDEAGNLVEVEDNAGRYVFNVEKWLSGSGPAQIEIEQFNSDCGPQLQSTARILFIDSIDGAYSINHIDGFTGNTVRVPSPALEQEILAASGQEAVVPPTLSPTPLPTATLTPQPTGTPTPQEAELERGLRGLLVRQAATLAGLGLGGIVLCALIIYFKFGKKTT